MVVLIHLNDSHRRTKEVAIAVLGHLVSVLSGKHIPDVTNTYNMRRSKGTGLSGAGQQTCDIIARYAEVGVTHMALLKRVGAMRWDDVKQRLTWR